ncbi:MAG: hypothetical protein ACI9LV_000670 [Candidatus Nanohaloarchaea archaeon]|jgi:hypothetical protein
MILDKQVNQIYLYETFRTFGMDLIGLFIPIYILSQGLGFQYALGFLIVEQLVSLVLSLPVSYLIARIGFKHSLIISYIFLLPALLVLRTGQITGQIIVFSAVIYSLGKILHGLALNSEFAVDSHQKKRDSESSRMLGLPNISRFLAPVSGGYILNMAGFNILVSTSILFFTISAGILLISKDHRDPLKYNFKDIVKNNYSKTFPVFFARGILNITAVTGFALFTFFFIGNEVDAGLVAAIDNLGLLITAIISGKLSSRFGRKHLILFGFIGSALIHFSRGLATTPTQAVAISGLGGLVFMFYEVPLFSDYADLAEKEDVLEFYTAKRMLFKAGQLLTLAIIVGVGITTSLKQGFQTAFILAGLTSASLVLLTREDWI